MTSHKKYRLYDYSGEIWISSVDKRPPNFTGISLNEYAKCWWQNGLLHRLEGPARIWIADDFEYYYQYGMLHRLDGPAIQSSKQQYYKWFIKDKEIECHNNEHFLLLINMMKLKGLT